MSFNFLNGNTLEADDFNLEDKVAYIDDFLYSNSVTLVYSPPKQGKTWLNYGIATTLAARSDINMVIEVDMDNGLSTLKERGIDEKLINHPKIEYVSRAKIGCEPMEYLRKIDKEAVAGNYKGIAFIFETTKDFVDTDSKAQSEEFMKIMMRIRDAGATVIIMHHASKAGRTISGVQVFINSPDNVYEMVQKSREDNKLHFMLNVTHARNLVKDIGVTVDTGTLELTPMDEIYSTMGEYEEEIVRKAMDALKKNPNGLGQTELLNACGKDKTDKTARDCIEKFVDRLWDKHQEKKGKPITYKLKS